MSAVQRRKLIEVALPLEKINAESAREKSIRHGHPSTLHLWWARRPLAAARAVLFAQLVDDPSARPEEFPTEEDQRRERERLHGILEQLVVWENSNNTQILDAAKAEIMKSTGGNPPPILDPFAGGGTIPLEAQRLGLEAHASDLNPVAVLINKALIEIPPKFADLPPVFPGLADSRIGGWSGAEGLAADVRAYGEWMRDRAVERIGHLYPKATLPDGTKATVIAWIWARTVTCPNPACGIEMPLVRSWWLGKKKGKEAYVGPEVVGDPTHPSGLRVRFDIGHDAAEAPTVDTDGTVGRTGAVCVNCKAAVPLAYVRAEGRAGRMGARLMAIVAEGRRRRMYLAPTPEHEVAALIPRPANPPEGELPNNSRDFRPQIYGMPGYADLFTARQLTVLTTFGNLVNEAREAVLQHTREGRLLGSQRLEALEASAEAYADAVATYLALAQSKITNVSCSITTWMSDRGAFRETFARQALPMSWDYAEANLLSEQGGGWLTVLDKESLAVATLPTGHGWALQRDAAALTEEGVLLSTDPPYYNNIGYSDLSDFFYVWLRRSLSHIHPELFATVLVPKADELVANPYRHGGKQEAAQFFEHGFARFFERARKTALDSYPITVFYAFKQAEQTSAGEVSTGWETLLQGMVHSGWSVTATWPVRTEGAGRILARDANALSSSIVLALRPRPDDAPTTDRRGFIAALKEGLPTALREMQQGRIAPVDLPQAAIGPGMAVFTRYSAVVERDGGKMRVRDALARINEILDEVLAEQEGDFDATTRFAIAWFRQHGYGGGQFGDADSLARARGTAVDAMARAGILRSGGGVVALIRPADLPWDYDPAADQHITAWEVVHHLVRIVGDAGIEAAGRFFAKVESRTDAAVDPDLAKELAFLLFAIAEDNGWTKEAVALNELGTAWPDIVAASRHRQPHEQASLDYDGEDD